MAPTARARRFVENATDHDVAGATRSLTVAGVTPERSVDENKERFAVAFSESSRRPDDDFDDAYDVFFVLDSAAFVRILVDDRGWSFDKLERWLATILKRLFTTISY